MLQLRAPKHSHTLPIKQCRLLLLIALSVFSVGLFGYHVSSKKTSNLRLMLKNAPGLSCAQHAASVEPSAKTVSKLLAFQSRELPPTDVRSPVLAASNWNGSAELVHAESSREQLIAACGSHIFRYRVVSRVVYTDRRHATNDVLKGHRDTFLEILLTAIWIYKSFPDVDLWVNFADEPSRCTLNVPVLQYTVIGLDETQQASTSNMVKDKDGSYFSVSNLLTGGGEAADATGPAPKFTRGWAFNYPYAWETLSFLPDSLATYQTCLSAKSGGHPHKAQLIWRGGNTGGRKGWAPLSGPSSQPLRHPWGVALTNKRMALSLLARSHADIMDVGLHDIIPELMGPEGGDKQLVEDLKSLMIRPFVAQELWGAYAVQLSIDGHGSPNRLPLQYLQGSSVILKMTSPYKDSFEELFKPGVHYESCKYDMSDLVPRTQELIERFKAGKTGPFQRMAAAAAIQAVDTFNMLGQLDALMYAILKVNSVCKWEVQMPRLKNQADGQSTHIPGTAAADEWELLVMQRTLPGNTWKSPTLRAAWAESVRSSILKELHRHFEQ